MDEKSSSYSEEHIQVLEGLEAVRKRPAMYIGDVGKRGLHHLVYEIIDNSIDEALAGYCKNIEVLLNSDGSVTVDDDGRGIPVGMHKSGKSALEVVVTVLHAGGKFDKGVYKVSGGLHGVGISVVNALSEWMEVIVKREGKIYYQKYVRGVSVDPVKTIGETTQTGTRVNFKPSKEIFSSVEFDFEYLKERIMELAFLNKGLKISLNDETKQLKEIFNYAGGIVEFVEYLNKARTKLHLPYYVHKTVESVDVEFSLQYTESYNETMYSFVNDIKTIEGGTHLSGFKTALTRVLNDYINSNFKNSEKASGNDALEGLTAVLSIKVPEPQFEGQTKTKLGNSEIKGLVDSVTYDALKSYLEENPDAAKKILQKVLSSIEAREAAQKAKELIRRKTIFESSVLPGKLADCLEKDPALCELYFVEGDSAGGCFSGDTKVALADGRNLTFKELVEEDKQGKTNYCYTILKDGSIGIELIKHPRLTKRNVEVVKFILDNGEELICTPDHKFMDRNYTYIQAHDINSNISLMPLHKRISRKQGWIKIEGYEMVFDPKNNKWVFTHVLADNYNIRNGNYARSIGDYKHHIDFNKLNNSPENIRRMTRIDHIKLHAKNAKKTLHTEDVRKKALEGTRRVHEDPEYRRKIKETMSTTKMRRMLSERAKKQWKDQEYKEYMAKKYIQFYESNEDYKKGMLDRLYKSQRDYWSKKENRETQSKRVKSYFKRHPEKKEQLSEIAIRQWQNQELKNWRKQKTKKQWTEEFRKRRKKAYDETYFRYTASFMKKIFESFGNLDFYEEERVKSRSRNLLMKKTFVDRFFNGDKERMLESIRNYNHKIKEIIKLEQRMDVYDLEVQQTNNFALASGVFVHNSCKSARDRKFQAILPLKGKILNVEKAPIHKALGSEEIKAIALSLGGGFGTDFDPNKIRYHKLLIMTDADVDGSHIRTLLLTLFYRYFRSVIDKGYLYIAQPPLYKVKKGKQVDYAYSDDQLQQILKTYDSKAEIQRYKGLGEMNPDQLWETTMDPQTRTLKQVTIEDAMKADEIFTVLMGSEVEPRREFIQAYAKEVKNLDI